MLVLTRKVGESILIDGVNEVRVLEVRGKRVLIGVKSPNGVVILRGEIVGSLTTEGEEDDATTDDQRRCASQARSERQESV